MKANKFFLGLATMAVAGFAFSSCASDDDMESALQRDNARAITFTSSLATTRATTDPQSGTSLATGQYVGIFGVSSESTTTMTNYDNNKYETAASNAINFAGTEGSEMTWPTASDATASIYAYIPWQSGYTVGGSNSFSVAADQSSEANYLASDLLLAKAANQAQNTTVTLPFSHLMSQIRVIISKAEGSNINLENATVSITNVDKTVVFTPNADTPLGATSSNGNITAATIASDLTAGSGTATAYALIVPQTLAAGTAFIQIVAKDTENNSKTLIGKLGEAATFASGTPYSLTISVGTITDPVTEVAVSLGAASLIAWDTVVPIGLTAYGVGDYVLTDGTFMKASAYADATSSEKAKVAGIIFSTTVSSTDATAGYNAYAMGLERKKQSFTANSTYPDQMYTPVLGTAFSDVFDDLDGLTKTTAMLSSDYYNALDTDGKTAFIGNMSWYTKTISANASTWFLPSFGQLMLILNNLGSAEVTSSSATVDSSSSEASCLDATKEETVVTAIAAKVTAVGGSADMFKKGNIDYVSSTENGSANSTGHSGKVWGFKIKAQNSDADWAGLTVGRHYGRGDTQYSVIPVVAVKLPAVAE